MPVITLDQFAQKCQKGLDVMYLARKHSVEDEMRHLSVFETITKIKILKRTKNPKVEGYTYAPTVILKRVDKIFCYLYDTYRQTQKFHQ